jgi:hypothetical protein
MIVLGSGLYLWIARRRTREQRLVKIGIAHESANAPS